MSGAAASEFSDGSGRFLVPMEPHAADRYIIMIIIIVVVITEVGEVE